MSNTATYTVVVLQDCETYSDIDGCAVLEVKVPVDSDNGDPLDQLDQAIKDSDTLSLEGEQHTLPGGIQVTLKTLLGDLYE